jgi:ATP-binding cassette subfamily B protein
VTGLPLLRILRRTLHDAPATATGVLAGAVASAAAALVMPAALAGAVDAAATGSDPGRPMLLLAAVVALGALARVLAGVAGAFFAAGVAAAARRRLVDHVLAAGPFALGRFPAGGLLSRLTVDAESPGALLPVVAASCCSLATSLGALCSLALLDVRLALAFLAGLPVALAVVRVFMGRAPRLISRYEAAHAAIAARLLDAQAGARTIRAAGTLDRELERVLTPVADLDAAGRELWAAQRDVGWQAGLLFALVPLLVLGVAGLAVAGGELTAGGFLAAAGYTALALAGLEEVEALAHVARAQVGAGRVAEVLAADAGACEPTEPRPLPSGTGAVRFERVSAGVLRELDLELPGGSVVALVGRSGAGKSTLAALPGRLADPAEGVVRLDGADVRTLALDDVRRAVAYAFARPAPLGDTVAGLIALGRPGAARAEVQRAARLAEADGFIRRLPHGYDTPLAQAPLSGGERQRLGIAQALIQDARLVVLDDATSSLDTATEARVSAALAHALAGRTSLVVAHRPATAAAADLVAWLEDGRVRALAPHAELWRRPDYRAVFAPAAPDGEPAADLRAVAS